MEKTHLYIINNASITPKDAFSVYKWIHFGNMSCKDSLIISLHGDVNNSKFAKKHSPESRPTPPLNRHLRTFILERNPSNVTYVDYALLRNVT